MPVFTRIGYLVAGAISVAVFGSSAIGATYSGVVLNHIADVVHGTNTSVVVSSNAPNWAIGTPLPTVVGVAAATTTGGTIATSTSYVISVAALDANGTTTLSSPILASSDSTGSANANEGLTIYWAPVPGATGYAIYFATSTSLATTLNQYVYATSTATTSSATLAQYTFASSTGSFAGTYTKLDTTAFTTLINPVGPSYITGANGNATTTVASSSAFEVNGLVRIQSQATSTNCYASLNGEIFYSQANGHLWICEGAGPTWTLVK